MAAARGVGFEGPLGASVARVFAQAAEAGMAGLGMLCVLLMVQIIPGKASSGAVLPLLIFDQFEEIFTLAQADDAGRRRARQFLDELADKGGLQKAWGLFGKELDTLMNEMNVELVA